MPSSMKLALSAFALVFPGRLCFQQFSRSHEKSVTGGSHEKSVTGGSREKSSLLEKSVTGGSREKFHSGSRAKFHTDRAKRFHTDRAKFHTDRAKFSTNRTQFSTNRTQFSTNRTQFAMQEGSSFELQLLSNSGRDCWESCNKSSGYCNWCGRRGACCKRSHSADSDECFGVNRTTFGWKGIHECVLAPTKTAVQTKFEPSVFVAVFSRRNAEARRKLVRGLWTRVEKEGRDASVKFAICMNENSLSDDGWDTRLQEEDDTYHDLLFLDCEEGYSKGFLTRKVVATMQHYRLAGKKDYFMKIDDDSFLAWRRFISFLKWHGSPNLYMGVPIDQSVPCRTKFSKWYEPKQGFPDDLYPIGFAGGSGYVLGGTLVDTILDSDIAQKNMLFNEDRAVSVWVDKVVRTGEKVHYVAMPGISGFWSWGWEAPMKAWGTWRQYPHLVHHDLTGETIACLSTVEEVADLSQNVSLCFAHEVGRKHEVLTCHTENKEGMFILEKAIRENNSSLTRRGDLFLKSRHTGTRRASQHDKKSLGIRAAREDHFEDHDLTEDLDVEIGHHLTMEHLTAVMDLAYPSGKV